MILLGMHVQARLRALGREALHTIGSPAELIRAARAHASEPPVCFVVLGGDGTVSALASCLLDSAHTMVPLPCGTANLLCRDLGIFNGAESPTESFEAALSAPVWPIDVATVALGEHELLMLNNLVLGLYADLAEVREAFRSLSVTSLQQAWRSIHGLPERQSQRYRIEADDALLVRESSVLVVSVNRYDRVTPPWPGRSRLDAGELVAYVGTDADALGFLKVLATSTLMGLEDNATVEPVACSTLSIDSEATIRAAVDGEVIQGRGPIRIRLRPRALRVPIASAPADG